MKDCPDHQPEVMIKLKGTTFPWPSELKNFSSCGNSTGMLCAEKKDSDRINPPLWAVGLASSKKMCPWKPVTGLADTLLSARQLHRATYY